MKYFLLSSFLFLLSCSITRTDQRYPEITFFDVGNGTCSVILCSSESAIMYDCGYNKKGTNKNDLISKINDYISDRELRVILSHADKDHVNLVEKLLTRGNVKVVTYGGKKDTYPSLIESRLSIHPNLFELSNKLDNFCSPLTFNLIPFPSITNKNESSIILHIKFKDESIILSGDATGKTEANAISKLADVKNTKLLMSSHHGASTHNSNSSAWLQHTQPESVVTSAGDVSNYGHPRCEVNKRFENYVLEYSGSHKNSCWESGKRIVDNDYSRMIYNTFDLGDITYRFDDGRIYYNKSPAVLKTKASQTKENNSSQNVCILRSEIKRSLQGCCSGNGGIKRCTNSTNVMCLKQQIACNNGTYSKSCRCD